MQTLDIAKPDRDLPTPSERRSARRYVVEIIAASVLYTALVIVSVHSVDALRGAPRVADALLPVAGILGMAAALVRYTLRQDELQRRMFVTAGAIAALISVVSFASLGFLQNAGVPPMNVMLAGPLVIVIWGLTLPFVRASLL